MTEDILFFFDKHMDALPLYEAFEQRVMNEIENVRIKVQKTQVSFYNKHSFARIRKKRIAHRPILS